MTLAVRFQGGEPDTVRRHGRDGCPRLRQPLADRLAHDLRCHRVNWPGFVGWPLGRLIGLGAARAPFLSPASS